MSSSPTDSLPPPEKSSPVPSTSSDSGTDDVQVEVHLFPCGQGDTILLHARGPGTPGGWVLIDCRLVDGARRRFFEFARERGVDELKLVVQTHADLDHFLGMTEVLDHFTREGRRVGAYLDLGCLDLKWVARALHRQRAEKYLELQRKLNGLAETKTLRLFAPDADPPLWFRLTPEANPVVFRTLYPTSIQVRKRQLGDVDRLVVNPGAEIDSNDLALVTALSAPGNDDDGGAFRALFASDASRTVVEAVLDLWSVPTGGDDDANGQGFDLIKVPHHGSHCSHSERLVAARRDGGEPPPVAAVSCGTDHVLPDRRVLEAFRSAGWSVHLTTHRHLATDRRPTNHALDVAGDRKRSRTPFVPHEVPIEVRWSGRGGLETNESSRFRPETGAAFGEAKSGRSHAPPAP